MIKTKLNTFFCKFPSQSVFHDYRKVTKSELQCNHNMYFQIYCRCIAWLLIHIIKLFSDCPRNRIYSCSYGCSFFISCKLKGAPSPNWFSKASFFVTLLASSLCWLPLYTGCFSSQSTYSLRKMLEERRRKWECTRTFFRPPLVFPSMTQGKSLMYIIDYISCFIRMSTVTYSFLLANS